VIEWKTIEDCDESSVCYLFTAINNYCRVET